MSDTPRTDELRDKLARLGWNPYKDKPVADLFVEMEKLERELAEAREKLAKAINDYETAVLREHRMQEQRDTLVEALRKCVLWAECMSMRCERDRDNINWSYLNDAREALAAVKGGQNG